MPYADLEKRRAADRKRSRSPKRKAYKKKYMEKYLKEYRKTEKYKQHRQEYLAEYIQKETTKEHLREYFAEYRTRPYAKTKHQIRFYDWKYTEKYPFCLFCGSTIKLQHHHLTYKRGDVITLCLKCHQKLPKN